MRSLSICLAFLLTACAGENFDATAFPPDQHAAQLAFKRLHDHGGMEAVLEDGQTFSAWQFYVASTTESVIGNEPAVTERRLEDGSGIDYVISSNQAPELTERLAIGTYGFGTGRILKVERDLPAGRITAEVDLTEWRVRE